MSTADRERALDRLGLVLAARPEVLVAFVYGSFVDADAFGDIDVGVFTSDADSGRVDLELAVSCSNELGLPVDVRRVNDAPVSFLFHVLRGRPLVVRDERFVSNLMERIAREHCDRAPRLRLATREAFAR
jgi:hypothetical protein